MEKQSLKKVCPLLAIAQAASGQTRAWRAYMKAAAREMQLRMVYFKDADADLKAEWAEFQRWRRSEKKRRVNAGKRGRKA